MVKEADDHCSEVMCRSTNHNKLHNLNTHDFEYSLRIVNTSNVSKNKETEK